MRDSRPIDRRRFLLSSIGATSVGLAGAPISIASISETTAAQPKQLIVPYTNSNPEIDGVTGTGEWNSASKYTLTFQNHFGEREQDVKVHLQHDGESLYVALDNGFGDGWDNNSKVLFDGNGDGNLNGSGTLPHEDIQVAQPAPGGWGGYDTYKTLSSKQGVNSPSGLEKASASGSGTVTYEFKIPFRSIGVEVGDVSSVLLRTHTSDHGKGERFYWPVTPQDNANASDWADLKFKNMGNNGNSNNENQGNQQNSGTTFGAEISELTVDRRPAVIGTQSTTFTRPGVDTTKNFGVPMSSNLLIEVKSNNNQKRTIDRVRCIARNESGDEVKRWTNPLKVNITEGTYTYRTMINPRPRLPPGSYQIEVELQIDTKQVGRKFETIDTATTKVEVKPMNETPVVTPPTGNYDKDGGKENALGKQYQSALNEKSPAVRFFRNTLDIITGLYANDTLPSFGVDKKRVNELAGKTARARFRSSEDGNVDLFWENRQRKPFNFETPISIWYDRAVTIARVPDMVDIQDSGDADYVIHNQDSNRHILMWIQTEVGHGIKPKHWSGAGPFTFAYDNPSGKQQFQLTSPTDEAQEVEVNCSVSLELGPLRDRSESPIYFNIAEEKPISEMRGFYDFEKWKQDPQSVYWMSIGLTKRSTKVTAPASKSSDLINDGHYPTYLSNDPEVLAAESQYDKVTKWGVGSPEELEEFLDKYDISADEGYRVVSADSDLVIGAQGAEFDEGPFSDPLDYRLFYKGQNDNWGYRAGGETVMRVLPRIIPDDNVIDCFMVGTVNNTETTPVFEADIYVDEEFRNAVNDDLNVFKTYWDEDIEEIDVEPYEFNEIAPGVYRDTVRETRTDAFQQDSYGYEIYAVNMTESEFINSASEDASNDTEDMKDLYGLSISA